MRSKHSLSSLYNNFFFQGDTKHLLWWVWKWQRLCSSSFIFHLYINICIFENLLSSFFSRFFYWGRLYWALLTILVSSKGEVRSDGRSDWWVSCSGSWTSVAFWLLLGELSVSLLWLYFCEPPCLVGSSPTFVTKQESCQNQKRLCLLSPHLYFPLHKNVNILCALSFIHSFEWAWSLLLKNICVKNISHLNNNNKLSQFFKNI